MEDLNVCKTENQSIKRRFDNIDENNTQINKRTNCELPVTTTFVNQADVRNYEQNDVLNNEDNIDEKNCKSPISTCDNEKNAVKNESGISADVNKTTCEQNDSTNDGIAYENNSELSTSDTSSNENKGLVLFNGQDINNLTKSQMKKYKKMLSWEANKKDKRRKEKLRAKERKKEAKLNNIDLGPSRKQLKRAKMSDSPCKTGVIIDLSFDNLMIPKDMGKVIKQLLRVYTENRRSKTPMQLHLTSFEGRCKEEMAKHSGYENWDCLFHTESYLDIFPKEKLVYLSSESDNVIHKLEEDKYYIIGGLVDHNAHKGLCHRKAVEQGIQHGQLPIKEFFNIKTRKVFTINQVFEILLRVSEGNTFKEAFEKVLPQRINIVPNDQE